MIPYQNITLNDFVFYWGDSVLFHKYHGTWVPVRPIHIEEMEMDDTLEQVSDQDYTLQFRIVTMDRAGGFVEVDPLDIFESDDWISYEPPLGYFMLNIPTVNSKDEWHDVRKIVLLSSTAPQSRQKGFAFNRLRSNVPVDLSAIPEAVSSRIVTPSMRLLDENEIVIEIASRLNSEFPSSWYKGVLMAMENDDSVILDSSTCVIADRRKSLAHLLYNGVLLGHVTMHNCTLSGARLVFKPRAKATTRMETTVNSYIRSKLIYIPETNTEETINE